MEYFILMKVVGNFATNLMASKVTQPLVQLRIEKLS